MGVRRGNCFDRERNVNPVSFVGIILRYFYHKHRNYFRLFQHVSRPVPSCSIEFFHPENTAPFLRGFSFRPYYPSRDLPLLSNPLDTTPCSAFRGLVDLCVYVCGRAGGRRPMSVRVRLRVRGPQKSIRAQRVRGVACAGGVSQAPLSPRVESSIFHPARPYAAPKRAYTMAKNAREKTLRRRSVETS